MYRWASTCAGIGVPWPRSGVDGRRPDGLHLRVRLSATCEGRPMEGEEPALQHRGLDLRTNLTMEWLDDWLAGLVHRSAQGDPAERARQERFIVSRTVSALVALAGLPPYLLARAAPTGLECLALLALAAPLAGIFVLSRSGRLPAAQAIVSGGLMPFVAAAAAAFGGFHGLAALALVILPLDALVCGSRRPLAAAAIIAVLGLPVMATLGHRLLHVDPGPALAVVLTVASALCLGHLVAQAVGDRRLEGLLRSARRDGAARENLSLQAIDDLVTWHDRNGQVLRASAGAARMVGAPGAMLQGRGLFARIHVSDRPAFLKAISDAATSAEPVAVQFRLQTGEIPACGLGHALDRPSLRSAGPLIWVEMRSHRLRDEDGCAVVAVTRDITAHK